MNRQIVIEVSGGVVTAVHGNTEFIEVHVVDWDNIELGESAPDGVLDREGDVDRKKFPFLLA